MAFTFPSQFVLMVAMALLSRVVGSSAFRSAGRLRPTCIAKIQYVPLAFTSSYTTTRASTSHRSSTYYRQRCFHPSVVCFGTASSSGNYARAELEGMTVNELKVKLREEGLPTSGLKAELIDRLSASNNISDPSDPSPDKKKAKPKQPQSSKRKFQINPNWKTEFNAKALEEEFDNMARKEGFDEKLAYFANDNTFEDEFTDDDYEIDLDEDGDGDDDDVDSDIPDFGQSTSQSMDERIAAARRDHNLGRVTVPKSLDQFSQEVSFDDLKKLGFRREANPFGNDETPRRAQFKVITGSMTCSGCGSGFQKDDELRPGFLPSEKYEVQVKLSKIEEAQKQNERADAAEWSPEDEVEWLLRQNDDSSVDDAEDLSNLSIDEMAEKMGLDLETLSKKKVICKRCHQLQNFGSVEKKLRSGWTDEPTLSQEEFRKLLLPLRQKKAVILALVDLFDFSGSVLPELDRIAGDNPVILAANKADLLPSEMGQTRAENWVRRELEYAGVTSIANIGGAVRLVSCKTGFGIPAMMEKTRKLADEMECDIYVVGAANAGKSTLVNYLLAEADPEKNRLKTGEKRRAGNANKWKGSVTTSPLPGTTLQFIKIELGGGTCLYDTPGLLVPGCLTERLTPEELKIVVPKK
jgi:GTPase SAR1 family protein